MAGRDEAAQGGLKYWASRSEGLWQHCKNMSAPNHKSDVKPVQLFNCDPSVLVFCCYGVIRLVFGGRNSSWNMSGCSQILQHLKEVGREMADDKTSPPLCEGCSHFPLKFFSQYHISLLQIVQLKLLGQFGLTFGRSSASSWQNRNKTRLSAAACYCRGSLWGTSGWWKELPCPPLPRTLRTHAPHCGAPRPRKWKSGTIGAIVGGCFSHRHPPLSVS